MVSLWLFLENLSWKPPPSFWLSGLPSKPAAQPLSFEFFIFYWIEFPIHWVSCSCLFLFILISENTTWIFFRQKDDAMTEVWPWQLSVCLASDSLWSYPDQLPSSGALCSHRAFPSPSSCDFCAYSSSVLVYFPILMRYIIQYIPDNKCKESKIYWDLTCWKWLFFFPSSCCLIVQLCIEFRLDIMSLHIFRSMAPCVLVFSIVVKSKAILTFLYEQ